MSLNTNDHIINKIANLQEGKLPNLTLEVFQVSKARSTDDLFMSKREILESDLNAWFKLNLKKNLNKLKINDENGKPKFHVLDYSHEIRKPNYIAKIDLDTNERLKRETDKLLSSISIQGEQENKSIKFQVVKASLGEQNVHFLFYRSVKKSALRKKSVNKVPTIRDRNQLVIHDHDVVEIGGPIEMFIVDNNIYVIRPTTLEYAFDYTDHIKEKRDKNLERIVSMNFFDEDSKIDTFVKKSNHELLSRGLADIKEETLEVLEENFEDRCSELRQIEENIPDDPEEKEIYMQRFEPLWPLYKHLDLNNNVVRFNEKESVTPLLHFFSDKIVESFLTKQFKS